jgi:hypothetical protein
MMGDKEKNKDWHTPKVGATHITLGEKRSKKE